MGAVPKVAFVEFMDTDSMHHFVQNFAAQNKDGKLWVAPKRASKNQDESQIVLNKIKRAICELTSISGKAILCDRTSKPR
eukprot:12219215-Karenia_brevis.AAC.1